MKEKRKKNGEEIERMEKIKITSKNSGPDVKIKSSLELKIV
jgi:hypothetical protein